MLHEGRISGIQNWGVSATQASFVGISQRSYLRSLISFRRVSQAWLAALLPSAACAAARRAIGARKGEQDAWSSPTD
jgi:hypothetical protein